MRCQHTPTSPHTLVTKWHTPHNQQTMRTLLVTTWQRTTQLPHDAAAHAVDHELGYEATQRVHKGYDYVWGDVCGGHYCADIAYARTHAALPKHYTPLTRLQTLVMRPQPQASAVPLPHPNLTNDLLYTVARALPSPCTLDAFNARVAALPQLAPPDVYVLVGKLHTTDADAGNVIIAPTPRLRKTTTALHEATEQQQPSTAWMDELHARADVQMKRLNKHWQDKLDNAVRTMRNERHVEYVHAWRVASLCALGVGVLGWWVGRQI